MYIEHDDINNNKRETSCYRSCTRLNAETEKRIVILYIFIFDFVYRYKIQYIEPVMRKDLFNIDFKVPIDNVGSYYFYELMKF